VASLGSFGKRKDRSERTFGFFDLTVRVNPTFGQLDLVDFMESARAVEQDDPSAMALVKDVLRAAVHPDDFDAFWRVAKTEQQDVEDLMAVLHAIVEALAERPTSQPSDSSAGLPTTAPRSSGGSDALAAKRRLEEQGRPDLAVAVLRREMSQTA
jgi:hypothetical protein